MASSKNPITLQIAPPTSHHSNTPYKIHITFTPPYNTKKPISPPNLLGRKSSSHNSSTRFSLEGIPRQSIGARLVIPEEILLDTTGKWERCMVGLFPGFRMSYHAVNTIAFRVWKNKGLENVMTTTNGFMLFRFKTELEMQEVLEKAHGCLEAKLSFCSNGTPILFLIKTKYPNSQIGFGCMDYASLCGQRVD